MQLQKSAASISSKLPMICSELHFLGYLFLHEIRILYFIVFFLSHPVDHGSCDFIVGSGGSCTLDTHFVLRSCGSWIFYVCYVVRSWGSFILNWCFIVGSRRSWILTIFLCDGILGILDPFFSWYPGELGFWLSDFAMGSCRSWILNFILSFDPAILDPDFWLRHMPDCKMASRNICNRVEEKN